MGNPSSSYSSTPSAAAFVQPASLRVFKTPSTSSSSFTSGRNGRPFCCELSHPHNHHNHLQSQPQSNLLQHRNDKQTTPPAPSSRHQKNSNNTEFRLPRILRSARFPKTFIATIGAILGTTCQSPRPIHPSDFHRQHHHNQNYPCSIIPACNAASSTTQQDQQRKEVRYNGRQELDSREKAMSLMLTGGTFAVLGIWAWKQNRRDDELENVRIKDEVERLEKLRAEFLDVEEDEDSLDDEDLLASLKQRLSDDEDEEGEGKKEGEDGKEENKEKKNVTTITDGDDDTDENGIKGESKNGVVGDSDTKTEAPSADSVDMLRRMWEATDEDPKKEDSK